MGGKTENESKKKSGDWKMIFGGILLIIVLFMGIKFTFWGLEQVIPKQTGGDAQSGQSVSAEGSASEDRDAPSFCVYCSRALPESFQWGQFCPWCGEKNQQ